ncbi:hypothetical protein C4573_01460 [Candidatus Woesearchaeota archaeon]|nr:MAG: hypothetical protein C4573_01460 [Candidatus Woesearchaeota archaeon]
MDLSDKRQDMLRKMPQIESAVHKSKDGKFIIHKTTITSIKPANYYQAVLEGKIQEEQEEF